MSMMIMALPIQRLQRLQLVTDELENLKTAPVTFATGDI